MANEFPSVWFETFLSPQTAAPVDRELEFIGEHLPVGSYPRLLDVPCGIGRHAGPLANHGYDVLGIDRSEEALAVARASHPQVDFRRMDMAGLDALSTDFDGVLCLWHSFGWGTPEENHGMLAGMAARLREGGRMLLDIYNAEAAAELPAEGVELRAGRTVSTRRRFERGRLHVEIEYSGSDVVDVHDWQLFSPPEIGALAQGVGLRTLLRCAWFDPDLPPSAEHLRMQILFERDVRFP